MSGSAPSESANAAAIAVRRVIENLLLPAWTCGPGDFFLK
jgi:hypothetical protein